MIYLVNLNLSGNELQNAVIQPVGVLPGSAKEGQIVYNSSEKNLYIYNGSAWKVVGKEYTLPVASSSTLGGIKVGAGLAINDGVLSATGGGVADAVDWSNVQNKPEGLVIDESYVHTDNNYTNTEKTKLSGIAAGAQVNVIEKISVNGAQQSISEKGVNITVPTQASDINAIPSSEKGVNNGVASLDETGKVPSAQLPSYVDDVVEYDSKSNFPETGESGKIYIAKDTNLTYRWSGSNYVEISPSLALGETSSTAYPGDKGKVAYDHSQIKTGNPHGTTLNDFGVTLSSQQINSLPDNIQQVQESFDGLSNVAKSGSYEDLSNKPKLVKIQEGTLLKTEITKTINVTGGKIFSVMIYDSVTFEEVMTDKTYNAVRSQVKIDIAKVPTNDLTIVVSYIEVDA